VNNIPQTAPKISKKDYNELRFFTILANQIIPPVDPNRKKEMYGLPSLPNSKSE